MATLNQTYANNFAAADQAKGYVSGLVQRYRQWQTYRRTAEELNALSARELDDLGISRADINRIARDSAYGY